MALIAFDIATKTGWCKDGIYGTLDLRIKKDESVGFKLIRLKSKLKEMLAEGDIVVYERAAGMHKNAIIAEAKLIGVLEMYCEEHGIEYRAYSAKEIKKFATGNGNAGKPLVIKAVQEKYGYDGEDDNEADAIALYHLAKTDLNL